jgi:hypothetical protein
MQLAKDSSLSSQYALEHTRESGAFDLSDRPSPADSPPLPVELGEVTPYSLVSVLVSVDLASSGKS